MGKSEIPFNILAESDLIVDSIYEGGDRGNASDDPLSNLLQGVGNQGGFRGNKKRFIILYSDCEDRDWPDKLDLSTGRFVYYGDNKSSGHELHKKSRGNRILKQIFENLHSDPAARHEIPPFFIFTKHETIRSSRSVQFRGLAVPGYPGTPSTEDLVAIWKTSKGQRFQNYRSTFTILDESTISRDWINSMCNGNGSMNGAPDAWRHWVDTGEYRVLTSESTTTIRSVAEQTAYSDTEEQVLKTVFKHFQKSSRKFEFFAAHIFQMWNQRAVIDEVTQGSVDGGRDAIGRYNLGLIDDPVYVEFALEAKCYQPPFDGEKSNNIGVREVSRLISRIRHRQFGVLVTTSVIANQAYEEVREDRHPIIFICGRDIAAILIHHGYNSEELVLKMLIEQFSIK